MIISTDFTKNFVRLVLSVDSFASHSVRNLKIVPGIAYALSIHVARCLLLHQLIHTVVHGMLEQRLYEFHIIGLL
jgi:hypothetical protein